MTPTVSVLMSVYDEPIEWIKLAIDSILTQTFTDFEFIIVNDKPDRPELTTLLNQEAEKDGRINIVANPRNMGLAASLNKGISISKGKYIARMDADDISLPTRLEKQIKFLTSHKDIGICGTWTKKINKNGQVFGSIKIPSQNHTLKERIWFFCPFVHPTVIIRKELLIANQYNIQCRTGQDWDLWLRLAPETRFANLKNELLLYRIHGNNAPQKAGIDRTRASREYGAHKFIKEINLDKNFISIYLRYAIYGDLSSSELDKLFIGLLENQVLSNYYTALIALYLRERKKFGYVGLLLNPVLFRYPFKYIKASIKELCIHSF